MAAFMLSRLPAMANARMGTTCSIMASRSFSACASSSERTPAEGAVEELHRAQPRNHQLLVLVGAGADEHAGPGPLVLAPLVPRVLQRAAHRVEEEAVLGIGDLDPAWRDAEVERGELAHLVVLEIGALVDVGLVGDARAGVEEEGVVPARGGDGPERDRARADQLPVAEWVPGAGELAPEPDDRDVQTTSRLRKTRLV